MALVARLFAHPVDIIDRHGYDCKYDAFIARIENCCFPGKRLEKRFARESDSNSARIRNSFRPDKKSAINFTLAG